MDLTDDASHQQSPPHDLDLPSSSLDPLAAPKADQTPTPSLEPPLRDSAPSTNSILGSPSKVRPSSVIATKNTRKRMEDRHVVLHDLKAYLPSALQGKIDPLEHVSFYAVFDGHAGTDAAAYAAAHLHELLVESSSYPENPVQAFQEAFITCDKDFVATSKKSGSTAVCALIKGEVLYAAWLGDSQASLVRGGVPVKIIDSHKPNRDDERARIEALGGSIMHWGTWRVNGQLAVSRAIGDGEYKPFISAEPDVTTIEMNGSEEFIIVGCDGLWDTITPEEATEIVFDHLEEKKSEGGDIENISARLATLAKEKGSSDNITIIVVFLKPVDEVIKLGRLSSRGSGSAEADIVGISSTSEYVFSAGGRVSMEPSKDKPDFTSPNVSFTSTEGGATFSPDPFGQAGSLGNGFNISSENFDNNIADKRFSNENERPSDEGFSNENMAELLKKQSIDKVDDLLKMLDREDSSPTPDDDDARPLEEILAVAREQTEDQVDGVEDDDSSDDEIVELRRNGGNSSSSSGNSQLQGVLKLDDKNLNEEKDDSSSSSSPLNGIPDTTEPTMDPCEQVTVVATGPEECGTLVPPTQELPSHQEPVLEIVDTMTCSMVKEEVIDQDLANGADSNGVGVNVTFEQGEEPEMDFMLKTPGEEEQQLSQFPSEEFERETSVDTGESVDEHTIAHPNKLEFTQPPADGGLGVPDVQITPATPTRARTPEDMNEAVKNGEIITEVTVNGGTSDQEVSGSHDIAQIPPTIITTEPTPVKPSITIEPATPEIKSEPKDTKVKEPAKSSGSSKTSPNKPSGRPQGSSSKASPAKSSTNKSVSAPASKTGASKPTTSTSRATGTKSSSVIAPPKTGPPKPSSSTAPKLAGSRPTSSTVGTSGRTAKPADKSDPTKRPAKPAPQVSKVAERKPLTAKSTENGASKPSTKPPAPRTNPSKPKPTETKTQETKVDPKRPTSSTAPRPPATKPRPTPTVSRQPSNASSTSSARPRPGVAKPSSATTSRVVSNKPSSATGISKTPAPPKPASTSSKSSSGLSRSSSSATTRPTSSTASRAASSTTAVKPSAAAARVAAARAAAKAQKPGASKVKVPQAGGSKKEVDAGASNGVSADANGAPEKVANDSNETDTNVKSGNPVPTPSNEVHETVNKNIITGDSPGSGEQVIEVEPHVNGVAESEHSEC